MHAVDTILVTGAGGFVGSALCDHLRDTGYRDVFGATSADCDLTSREGTDALFRQLQPSYVFHMAAKVFGIVGNMQNQFSSFVDNTLINTHVIEACAKYRVRKVCAMGTVAMYGDHEGDAPIREDMMWFAPPHKSEYGYASAKRAMLAQLTVSGLRWVMPISTNLYGEGDRFNIDTGHVIPSLIRKFYEGARDKKPVVVWGNGQQRRDFLYIGDVCRALVKLMELGNGAVNMAGGSTKSIADATTILTELTGVDVVWDLTKPTGQVNRRYDVRGLAATGFASATTLSAGLKATMEWYASNEKTARKL